MTTKYISYSHAEFDELPKWLQHHFLSEYKWKVTSTHTFFLFH